jgi:hypothetical protein
MEDREVRNDELSQIDNLEIEPLSDEALEPVAGGLVIDDPCWAISCSGAVCSSDDDDVLAKLKTTT